MRRLALGLGLLLGGCWLGCHNEGHRIITFTAFGQEFRFEDEVLSVEEGAVYRCTLDNWAWAWLDRWAECRDEEVKVEP